MQKRKGPVLLLANSGFIIRNLLLGTFADAMARYRPLVVSVQNPTDHRLAEIVKGKPITLIPFPVQPYKPPKSRVQKLFSWQTYMYRFKEAEKATKAVELQTRLYESRHSALGAAAIQLLTETGRLLKKAGMMGIVEDWYLGAVARREVTQQWSQIMDRWQPVAVVSTMLTLSHMNKFSVDLPPVLAAHSRRIPCGTLVQSWDNLSSKTAVLPPWLDRYWTWSDTMAEELLALNPRVSPGHVRVVGSPQFDFHTSPELVEPRHSFVARLGLDPSRPYVLIGTGTQVRTPDEPATVLSLVRSLIAAVPECQALIRLHPKDHGDRWGPLMSELKSLGVAVQETAPSVPMDLGGFVLPKEFYREQVNCIIHAAAVINTSSTLTVDAAVLERPIICLGYDLRPDSRFPEGRAFAYTQSTHYAPLVETGGVWVVRSESECVAAVRSYLHNSGLHHEGRIGIVRRVTNVADGGAGERMAREVEQLIAE